MTKINTILYSGRNMLSSERIRAVRREDACRRMAHMNRANVETIDAVINQAIPRGPSEGIVSVMRRFICKLVNHWRPALKWMSGNETTINSIITETKISLIIAVYVGIFPRNCRRKTYRARQGWNDIDPTTASNVINPVPATRSVSWIPPSCRAHIRDQHRRGSPTMATANTACC